MFRRSTDDAIAERLSERPLDVGSDRIARTAHAALSFLERLRKLLDAPIPLAWEPAPIEAVVAIQGAAGRRFVRKQLAAQGPR